MKAFFPLIAVAALAVTGCVHVDRDDDEESASVTRSTTTTVGAAPVTGTTVTRTTATY